MEEEMLSLILLNVLEEETLVFGTLLALSCEDIAEGENRNSCNREVMPVNLNFWRNLGDPTFHDHFRMTRSVFENLVVALGNHLDQQNKIGFLRTPLYVALMMALWILATPDTFRSTGNQFGVNKSVVFFHYKYVCQALCEMAAQWVQWPGAAERDIIEARVEERYGYPGVVGMIDCCHIRTTAPLIQPRNYINRHHDYSIVIQATCNDQFLYQDIYIGEPGIVGDIRTFYHSSLCHNLFFGHNFLSEGEHLLGDGAYPLSPQIMTPFPNNGRLTNRQRAHNVLLSGARSCVETSFALLRGKWRRLKHLQKYSLRLTINHVVASVVLHNFVIRRGEPPITNVEIARPDVPLGADVRQVVLQARGEGAVLREHIAEFLHPIDD